MFQSLFHRKRNMLIVQLEGVVTQAGRFSWRFLTSFEDQYHILEYMGQKIRYTLWEYSCATRNRTREEFLIQQSPRFLVKIGLEL